MLRAKDLSWKVKRLIHVSREHHGISTGRLVVERLSTIHKDCRAHLFFILEAFKSKVLSS